MGFFIFLVITFLVLAIFSNHGAVSTVVGCNSVSCSHNRSGRCTKATISVYDNSVLGLCLDHSDNMQKRIIEPMIQTGMKFNITVSSSLKSPIVPVKHFRPQTNRIDNLDGWLN